MTQGFQAYDGNGNLLIDVTTRLCRITGSASIPAGDANQLTVPNASQGTIWWMIVPNVASNYRPLITVSGNVIRWSPRPYVTDLVASTLLYGVY